MFVTLKSSLTDFHVGYINCSILCVYTLTWFVHAAILVGILVVPSPRVSDLLRFEDPRTWLVSRLNTENIVNNVFHRPLKTYWKHRNSPSLVSLGVFCLSGACAAKDSISFIEGLLYHQLTACIGRSITAEDVDSYMRFHNRPRWRALWDWPWWCCGVVLLAFRGYDIKVVGLDQWTITIQGSLMAISVQTWMLFDHTTGSGYPSGSSKNLTNLGVEEANKFVGVPYV